VRDPARLRTLVTDNAAFVWRSLVRLGVPRSDAEDAVQQVFLVASQKFDEVELGRERSFLFGTVLRIASRARRTECRRRELLGGELALRTDPGPNPEEQLGRREARAALDTILDAMPLDLRAVFVLFELEQATMAEIGMLLSIPPGTVASRLRRAREHFAGAVGRFRSQRPKGGPS
jgi:RNA polymerase sigma-70 factor (ECF subfamily)